MTESHRSTPVECVIHNISIDDDEKQQAAVCSAGDFRFVSDNTNAKKAAAYRHLADILEAQVASNGN